MDRDLVLTGAKAMRSRGPRTITGSHPSAASVRRCRPSWSRATPRLAMLSRAVTFLGRRIKTPGATLAASSLSLQGAASCWILDPMATSRAESWESESAEESDCVLFVLVSLSLLFVIQDVRGRETNLRVSLVTHDDKNTCFKGGETSARSYKNFGLD